MSSDLPLWHVPRLTAAWAWPEIPAFPLLRAEDGSAPEQATLVRVAWNDAALFVRFECQDRDAWGTFTQRDEPLYEEEVVEVFLASGDDDPKRYFEIEVSPLGTLFDAVIHNPTGRRAEMTADLAWDCPGLAWNAGRREPGQGGQDWWAELQLPWRALGGTAEVPRRWRANFYRIERPRDGAAEFSAASPTFARPADFHRPERFGRLELADAGGSGRIR